MFDTYVTVVGNVLTRPEWRRTPAKDVPVANFKIASTARRLDRQNGRWVDGNSLRVRVVCWRKLAENVVASVATGDPLVVVGRLYTRDWTDAEGNHRSLYELEAVAVGHDLSRGRAAFVRTRSVTATSTVEDADAESRVQGQPSVPVAEEDAPVRYGDGLPEIDPDFAYAALPPSARDDEFAALRGGGFDADATLGGTFAAGAGSGADDPLDEPRDDELGPADGGFGSGDGLVPAGDGLVPAGGGLGPVGGGLGPVGEGEEPVPAGATTADDPVDDPVGEPDERRRRSRRGRARDTVPA